MNKSMIIQIGFVAVMMLLVSTVFVLSQKSLPKAPQFDSDFPDRPEWPLALASDKKEACATIQAQLDDFDRDDYAAASALQAPGLVHSTHEPDQLKRLVQTFYPEFAHYKSVQFKEARSNHSRNEVIVHILLTGKDNFTVSAFYYIIVINGHYLVGGVNGGEHPGRPFFQRRFLRDRPGPYQGAGPFRSEGHGIVGPGGPGRDEANGMPGPGSGPRDDGLGHGGPGPDGHAIPAPTQVDDSQDHGGSGSGPTPDRP